MALIVTPSAASSASPTLHSQRRHALRGWGPKLIGASAELVACASLTASCFAAPLEQLRLATGRGPGVTALADLNRDGTLDIVVANEQSDDVSVFLGTGRGGFFASRGSPYAAGQEPNDVAITDLDSDGHLDLAFANHEAQALTVLLGDGKGTFAPAPNSPLGVQVNPHPHGIAVGDFNADGNADLVTDSWGLNQLQILYGDGRGNFRTSAYVSVGKHPYQRIRVADLNSDGRSDIVSPNLEGNDVTILLGGRGELWQPQGSPFPCGASPFSVAVGDVNGDGKPDLAIVNSPGISGGRPGQDGLTILTGDGQGRFAMMPGSPISTGRGSNIAAIGDLNGDGVGDIAVSNTIGDYVTLAVMGRNAVKSTTRLSLSGHPKGVAIGDFNGDGKGDLVVANNGENRITVVFTD